MQAIIDFILAHQSVVVGMVVGLLDLVFALVPSWQSNGILHFLYVQAKKLLPGSPSPQ